MTEAEVFDLDRSYIDVSPIHTYMHVLEGKLQGRGERKGRRRKEEERDREGEEESERGEVDR